jgi:predicted ribosome-associated RNA-binding protein Tma20
MKNTIIVVVVCLIRKNLVKEIIKQYPKINEEELKSLIKPKDCEISLAKLVTHDGTDVIAYYIDKTPYFFKIDKEEQLIPTGRC